MADFYAECRDVETKLYKYYCEGEWRTSSSGKSVKNINPSTNAVAYEVQGILWATHRRAQFMLIA